MRRCGRSPSVASSGLLTRSGWRPRRLGSRFVLGSLLRASRGRRWSRDLASLPDGVEVARDRGALVVRDAVLLRAAHEDSGDRHAASRDRDVTVDDELTRLTRCEGEALQEREGLESPREDRLDIEREDIVERRALERQEPEAAESPKQLFPLLLGLLVPCPDARLEFSGPLPEPPQDVLGAPQLLLVLEPVLLQEFVLRLDAFGLPRMGRPLELRTGELWIAQRLTPSSPPASSLPSFLHSSGRLLPPSWPSRPPGRISSSPRPSGRYCRRPAYVARRPSGASRGALFAASPGAAGPCGPGLGFTVGMQRAAEAAHLQASAPI